MLLLVFIVNLSPILPRPSEAAARKPARPPVSADKKPKDDGADLLINPAGFTTTSVAILDALKAVGLPAVEIHLSNIFEREAFRQDSLIRLACFASVVGKGIPGYFEGLALLKERLTEGKSHSETLRTS